MTDPDRIPCVGAIVLDDAGRILLVRRANPPAQGRWSLPGGRVEQGEQWEDAVQRELLEETGVAARPVRFVGEVHRDAPGGGVYVIRDFLMRIEGTAEPVAGDDALETAWFTAEEMGDADTSAGLVQALAGWGVLGQ